MLLAELINNGEEIAQRANPIRTRRCVERTRGAEAFFSAVVWTLRPATLPGSADDSPVDTGPATAVSTTWTTWIAATAIVVDADLLTTNVRHFPMFRICSRRN